MAPAPRPPGAPPSSEITPPTLYARRREFIKSAGLYVAASSLFGTGLVSLSGLGTADPALAPPPLPKGSSSTPNWRVARRGRFGTTEAQTSYEAITTYNNYYEL